VRVILKTITMSEDLKLPEGLEVPETTEEVTTPVEESTVDATPTPEFTESTPTEPIKVGWELMRDYLSQSTEVLPEIKELMEKYKETHAVKVYKSEDDSQWELFLVHNSSIPTNQTCSVLRLVSPDAGTVSSYGFHKWVKGSKEEVLAAIASL